MFHHEIDTTLDPPGKRADAPTIPIIPVTKSAFEAWLSVQGEPLRTWLRSTDFSATANAFSLVPDAGGGLSSVILGMGDNGDYWTFGSLPSELPAGRYRIQADWQAEQLETAALVWGLGAYRYERYKTVERNPPRLVLDAGMNESRMQTQLRGTYLVRDLINTPAADMMPEHLAETVEQLAAQYQATVKQTVADALLSANYPVIHAVGRASAHAPRLIDLTWGHEDNPKVTVVGKGVCFDSGGLDIKPANSMRLMKKDMGGAAHALGLASMIMANDLSVRLRMLIPAVDNAISGDAYRPGDVLISRKGITIEIENTDAEGRLVLCDALTEAASEKPDLLIDFATLTGAARVALGTELPAFFTSNRGIATALSTIGEQTYDSLWQLPLHRPYRYQLDSTIADIANCSTDGVAGAITAALFLSEFVPEGIDWIHLDVMGWNSRTRPGRPKGGEAMGMRAVFVYLQERFGH